MVSANNQTDVSEADLLLPFELANLEGDYREYQKTRRNNCFASMQRLPDLWKAFAQLDTCWRAGLDDMRRITSADDMLPLSLYIRAHAQARISADLLFSGCLPEAAELLRTGVESAVHAYRIKEDHHLQSCGFKRMMPQAGERTRKPLRRRKRPVCSKALRTYITTTPNSAGGRTQRSHPSRSSLSLQNPRVT